MDRGRWYRYLAALLVGLCVFSGYQCACPPRDANRSNVIEFVPVDPNDYDRNYSSIADDGARPLGFMKGTVYYNQHSPDPCVHIGNAGTKRLEIMETFYSCEQSPGNDVYVEFSCDSRCGEADVTFWFRFASSPPPDELDPETWCADRNADEYPSSLLPFNPDLLPSPQTTPQTGGANIVMGRGPFPVPALIVAILYISFLGRLA